MHKHKCGFWAGENVIEFALTPPKARPAGCGHEWEHPDESTAAHIGEAASIAAHTCPSCGKGPWELQYRPETRRALELMNKQFWGA